MTHKHSPFFEKYSANLNVHLLRQALESFGLPIANVMMHFGMSYILDCVAVSAVAVCALLQMCIARRNQKIRESGFAGGVISYDTFAQDSKSMPMPL